MIYFLLLCLASSAPIQPEATPEFEQEETFLLEEDQEELPKPGSRPQVVTLTTPSSQHNLSK